MFPASCLTSNVILPFAISTSIRRDNFTLPSGMAVYIGVTDFRLSELSPVSPATKISGQFN